MICEREAFNLAHLLESTALFYGHGERSSLPSDGADVIRHFLKERKKMLQALRLLAASDFGAKYWVDAAETGAQLAREIIFEAGDE